MTEKERFDSAMEKLLQANPAVVKAAMQQEKKEREAERKAKQKEASKRALSILKISQYVNSRRLTLHAPTVDP